MTRPDAIIIGAGLAGLSCAIHAQERGLNVEIYEATPCAGGRIRSVSYDDGAFEIDNGTHLVIKAYKHAFEYLSLIDPAHTYAPARLDHFQFHEPATQTHWSVNPFQLFKSLWGADVPGFGFLDFFAAAKMFLHKAEAPITDCLPKESPSLNRFWEPIALAVFNTPLEQLSVHQFRSLFKQLAKSGGDGFSPYLEETSLFQRFVQPALARLTIHYGHRLKEIKPGDQLVFAHGKKREIKNTPVILALPYQALHKVEGLQAFPKFAMSPILNLHFFLETHQGFSFHGLIGTRSQWVLITPNRLSVTISATDLKASEVLAEEIWHEIAFLCDHAALPPYRFVSEKQATPLQDRAFHSFQQSFKNDHPDLIYAGDWTVADLPLTIESAILSGKRAAVRLKPQ